MKVEGAVVGDGAGRDGGVLQVEDGGRGDGELPASTVMVPPALAMVEVCSMVSVAPACTVMASVLVTISSCSVLTPAVTVSAPALASVPLRMASALKVEGAVVGDGAGGDGGVRRLTMAAAVTAELPASTVMVPSVLAIEVRRWSAWRRPAP